ncbi:imidazole glycerol phosphate synthase subunit HisH [Gracilimonas sp.]|uniref:imidazole glycerol phosphate synthase subunit HisH n=1 Tax=Gracilimonas sp. TaxID=1974203 RepID=UPI0032EB9165
MNCIVDLGIGNVGSLQNMIRRVGGDAITSSSKDSILEAEKLFLPGVGAFDNAMNKLDEYDLIEVLNKKVLEDKTPVLCICLGMQLITEKSEEGDLPGLGWIKGRAKKFTFTGKEFKIPHMGWNTVTVKNNQSKLNSDVLENSRYYFVHSYHVECENDEDILCTVNYGREFVAAIERDNIFATQFHPEKSHKFGMDLIESYLKI